jgi:opacity protein-like surface antigen
MCRTVLALAVIGFVLMRPAPAWAQGYLVPNAGYDFGGDAGTCPSLFTDCSEKKTSYGVTAGALVMGVFGFEEDLAFAPDFFGKSTRFGSNSVLTLMSNLVLSIPAGPVRPYVAGGIGLMRTRLDLATAGLLANFTNNGFGYNFGGGVMVLLPHHVGVRGDLRYLRSASDITIAGIALSNTHLNFTRVSVGLVIH